MKELDAAARPAVVKVLPVLGMAALLAATLALGGAGVHGGAMGNPGPGPDALICLDPGHGGSEPGAIQNGVEEKEVNLDVALRARALLELRGYRVMMTRTTDVEISLARRCSAANKSGAEVFVSVHNNARPPDIDGTTTYYNRGFEDAWRLAACVQRSVVISIGRPDRGLKTRRLYVLRNTRMPAVLLEGVFLTDTEEAGLARDPGFRQRMAEGIALGIDLYLRS